MQQVYVCNLFRELNCKQTIIVSWDKHLENFVLIRVSVKRRVGAGVGVGVIFLYIYFF